MNKLIRINIFMNYGYATLYIGDYIMRLAVTCLIHVIKYKIIYSFNYMQIISKHILH